ncbi:potassium channel family protein [uncultured Ruminococcus sp.]|uniref:potassium channel family protein n=1 Tax=uncultured Ruminococcus sp. TaxID=165186 RepID=UPI00260EB558|nr:potassium channel family protein [uncultured Ruminococcus sp.]
MKKLRLLKGVLKRTKANQIIISYLLFFFADALILWLIEPSIETYGDSLWYCFTVFSTIGFGDIIATTFIGRILTVFLSVLTIFVVAIVTGVVVAFNNDVVSMQYKASKAAALDKLENLDKLSKEELQSLSSQIKNIL